MADSWNLFQSARLLLRDARAKNAEFKKVVDSFLARQQYTVRAECELKSRDEVVYVVFDDLPPPEFSIASFHILNGLRGALDHAVYDSAVALKTHPDPRRTGFPFADDDPGVDTELKKDAFKHVPKQIIPVIKSLAPHCGKGGNRNLWAINKLRNRYVHRLLVPHAVSSGRKMGAGIFRDPRALLPPKWDAENNRVIILRTQAGSSLYTYVEAVPNVCFGEIPGVEGSPPAVSALNAMADEVDAAIRDIETETLRHI